MLALSVGVLFEISEGNNSTYDANERIKICWIDRVEHVSQAYSNDGADIISSGEDDAMFEVVRSRRMDIAHAIHWAWWKALGRNCVLMMLDLSWGQKKINGKEGSLATILWYLLPQPMQPAKYLCSNIRCAVIITPINNQLEREVLSSCFVNLLLFSQHDDLPTIFIAKKKTNVQMISSTGCLQSSSLP